MSRRVALPRLGEYWPGQGGIFHGLMLSRDGGADYALLSVELKHHHAGDGFDAMQDYPKKLKIDGHSDFEMPTRAEQRVQFANAKSEQFHDAYYWSCEQDASDSDYAWLQPFGHHGHQFVWHRDVKFRGCAVRRVPIASMRPRQ